MWRDLSVFFVGWFWNRDSLPAYARYWVRWLQVNGTTRNRYLMEFNSGCRTSGSASEASLRGGLGSKAIQVNHAQCRGAPGSSGRMADGLVHPERP